MPSKRELIGNNSLFNGLNWSESQWKRIIAFMGGVTSTILYFFLNPFQHLPDWLAAGFASIPAGLLLYSFTNLSWKACGKIAIGTSIGLGIGTYL